VDWLGVRAGRVKLPFGLYNDSSDVDSARVPILLPQSVYPISNRDFLLAQTGVELYGRGDLGAAGALDYRLYGGTIQVDLPPDGPIQIDRIEVPYLVGGRLLWETPVDGLRLGASAQALRLDFDLTIADAPVRAELPAVLAVGSLEYLADELLVAAEYSRWFVRVDSSDPTLASPTTVSERGYAMASYRLDDHVQPGLYYSVIFPDVDDRTGPAQAQHDVAATVRFDVDASWMVKLEGHYLHGTAGLDPALNGGRPLASLEPDWFLLMTKATASF
jgi:hypothetical protein